MSVSENDVKVLGRVVSIAVDGIVADAEQVYDTTVAKSQAEINAIIQGSIEDLGSNVYQTIMQLDGKIAGCQSSIQTTNSKIQAIEHDVAGKQDVLTFDSEPVKNSLNPVTSDGIKNAIDEIISYDSTYNRKTLESTYVQLTGHPCIYLTAGGEWPEDAGEIILHSTEGTVELIGDSYVHIRSGKQATTQSPIVGGSINIETGGTISISGDPVKINGKDISSTINNIFPSGSYTGDHRTTTPGLYLYEAGVDRNYFTPAVQEYTTGLLVVTHEHGIDSSTGDGWNDVCQLFIDMNGNRYSRRLSYTNSVQDIDWRNEPDFTLRS